MALSTSVGINGDRVELAFGAHFDVRYGKDDVVLRDAQLSERAKNGDLVFLLHSGREKVRVRPSLVDYIVGSGVDHSDPDDSPSAVVDGYNTAIDVDRELLARDRAEVTSRGVDEPAEEDDLTDAEAKAEIRRLRKLAPEVVEAVIASTKIASPLAGPIRILLEIRSALRDQPKAEAPRRLEGETGHDYLARMERIMGSSYATWTGTDTGQAAIAEAYRESVAGRRDVEKARPKKRLATEDVLVDVPKGPAPDLTPKEEAYLATEERRSVDAVPPPTLVAKTGKAYAERNQVWKCSVCKGRTRKPVCTGRLDQVVPHDPVSAPAGKRLADRLGDQ